MTVLDGQSCLRILGGASKHVHALVSIEDGRPQHVACFVLPDGDVLIPTGTDRAMPHAADGHWMTVQFVHQHPRTGTQWTMRAQGRAATLSRHDQRGLTPYTTGALRTMETFANGVRVRVSQLSGTSMTPDVSLPEQREHSEG